MTNSSVNIGNSINAINVFLEAEKNTNPHLVLNTINGKKQIQCVDCDKVINKLRKMVAEYFGWGNASLQNVMDFALKNNIMDKELRAKFYVKISKNPANANLLNAAALTALKLSSEFTPLETEGINTMQSVDDISKFIHYLGKMDPKDIPSLWSNLDKETKDAIFPLATRTQNEEIINFLHNHKLTDSNGGFIIAYLCSKGWATDKQFYQQSSRILNLLRPPSTPNREEKHQAFLNAAAMGYFDVVKELLKYPVVQEDFLRVDDEGNNGLHRIVKNMYKIESISVHNMRTLYELAELDPRLVQANKNGETPAMMLDRSKLPETLFLMIERSIEEKIPLSTITSFFLGKEISEKFANIDPSKFLKNLEKLHEGFQKAHPNTSCSIRELIFASLVLENFETVKDNLEMFKFAEGPFQKYFAGALLDKFVHAKQNDNIMISVSSRKTIMKDPKPIEALSDALKALQLPSAVEIVPLPSSKGTIQG